MNNEKVVTDAIAKALCIEESEIKKESDLMDLGADSLDVIEVIMEIEKELNISIPDSVLDNVVTVQSLVNVVDTLNPIEKK